MHFSINGQRITTKSKFQSTLSTLLSANQQLVPQPRVIARPTPPRDEMRVDVLPYECVYIDTMMTGQSNPKNDPYLFHVHRVSQGAVMYFYNDCGERLIVAMPCIVSIPDYSKVFLHFKRSTDLKMIITGGVEHKSQGKLTKMLRNLFGELLSNLYEYTSNPSCTTNIDIVSAKVIENNTVSKVNLCESMTPYLYHTLNMLSLRYRKTEFKNDLSFFEPKTNFKAKFTGDIKHLDAAIETISCIHPVECVPFSSLPDVGASGPHDYIEKLASILFTKQSLSLLEKVFCKLDMPDLENFIVDCDSHTYFRVNNYYDTILMFAPRIAKCVEQHLVEEYSLISFSINPPRLTPVIYFSPAMIVFIRSKLKEYELLKRVHLETFIAMKFSTLKYDAEDNIIVLNTIKENTKIMYGLLKHLDPNIEMLDNITRDLISVIEHYLEKPLDFRCHSPLATSGFFSPKNKDDLGYCKQLIMQILKDITDVSVKIYRDNNTLDITANDVRLPVLRKLSDILSYNGCKNSILKLVGGMNVIRLTLSPALIQSIADSYIEIEVAAQKSKPRSGY